MKTIGPTSGLTFFDQSPDRALISHGEASATVGALRNLSGDAGRDYAATLARYVAEREKTSHDMKSIVQAVLDVYGPSGLKEIQGRVEAARNVVGRKQ